MHIICLTFAHWLSMHSQLRETYTKWGLKNENLHWFIELIVYDTKNVRNAFLSGYDVVQKINEVITSLDSMSTSQADLDCTCWNC